MIRNRRKFSFKSGIFSFCFFHFNYFLIITTGFGNSEISLKSSYHTLSKLPHVVVVTTRCRSYPTIHFIYVHFGTGEAETFCQVESCALSKMKINGSKHGRVAIKNFRKNIFSDFRIILLSLGISS